MKKFISIILTAILCLSPVIRAAAADDFTQLYKSILYEKIDNQYEQSTDNTISLISYQEKWILIGNNSSLDTHIHAESDETVSGTYYFLDNKENKVVGNSSEHQITLSGYEENLSEQTKIYLSEGVNREDKLYSDLNYQEICPGIISGSTVTVDNQCFIPKYETTYYNVKIADGEKETVIRMKLEVQAGDVVVYGFQMNTCTFKGAVSEFMPSFRTVSRCSKLITKDNDSELSNKPVYAVKNFGTIYANYLADDSDMVFESLSENVRYYEADEQGILQDWSQAVDKESFYYALTMKFMDYNYDFLTWNWKLRAYAVTYDGDVILSRNIETTRIYDIAKVLYDNQMTSGNAAHEFLYDNVLNVVSMAENGSKIANSMLKALNIRSAQTLEYALANNMYQDMYRYTRFQKPYNDAVYYDRGTFTSRTATSYGGSVYNTEECLLELLNHEVSDAYGTLSEWIYGESGKLGFENFYPKVAYNRVNYVKPEDLK